MRQGVAVGALLVLIWGALPPVLAQSLGELARREEERRKALGSRAKVITNTDLAPAPQVSPPAPSATPPGAAAPTAPGTPPPAAGGKQADKPDPDKEPVKDQAYWSERQKALTSQLDRDQTYAEALQVRINSLTADALNRDDPAQRATISADRQKALAELNRLKEAIQADKKALDDFQEEARKAGVPPGWLR